MNQTGYFFRNQGILLLLVVLFMSAAPHSGRAEAPGCKAARDYIGKVTADVTKVFSNRSYSANTRERKFGKLMRKYTDFNGMNRFALGRYARVMPKSLMSRYYKLSQAFIVKTLFAKFGDFNGQTYKIWNCKPDKRGFNIGGYIHSATGVPIIDVKWWLRKDRSGKFIVSDLGVASFRLKIEQRNTFVPIIRKNGGNPRALLTYLKNQIAENT